VFKTKGGGTGSSKRIIVSQKWGIVEDKDVHIGVPSKLRDTIIFSKLQILPGTYDTIPGLFVVVSKQEDTKNEN
jgi:hypothetical protein